MKISQIFGLNRTQYELDFIDIDIERDTRLFLDPYFLSHRTDSFSVEATRTIGSFFQTFIDLMQAGEINNAREIFNHLHEPNETCLGLSVGTPRGNGIGSQNADAIFESIRQSRALQTGLLEHLEDFRIFVENIDKDKVSDMTTNIIREQLIAYTQSQAKLWSFPLQNGVASGEYWNRQTRRWEQTHTEMLVIQERKILLVPKAIVSYAKRYTHQQFHQHFVLNFKQSEHLRLNSALVQSKRNRNGEVRRWVTKESIKEAEAPLDKDFLSQFTQSHREVFARFRQYQAKGMQSLGNNELDSRTEVNDLVRHLKEQLASLGVGSENASIYHKTVAAILELLFYPRLTCLTVEKVINEGRKRIDITFDNSASSGIFWRLSTHHQIPCAYIMIECKNYRNDVANPEVDQLISRFHVNRGKFGMLICRTVQDRDTLIKRCRDAYGAGQGLIIPLMDADLIEMLDKILADQANPEEDVLTRILNEVTS
ncbi:hypothetical protein [Methylophilus sp. QUAN]|uniref:hypothetical protein n=1 Tax=Methylophilus sp. QUAN TaxID=2781020 RepID=UPI00188EEE58|nr:hypothetical protein [Methylophilus sp. QUAN]MBF4989606.1 hypothetical protein [Methylophilus sp. QUAN]